MEYRTLVLPNVILMVQTMRKLDVHIKLATSVKWIIQQKQEDQYMFFCLMFYT